MVTCPNCKSPRSKVVDSRNFKIKIAEPKTITDDALWEYIQLQKNLSKKKDLVSLSWLRNIKSKK